MKTSTIVILAAIGVGVVLLMRRPKKEEKDLVGGRPIQTTPLTKEQLLAQMLSQSTGLHNILDGHPAVSFAGTRSEGWNGKDYTG